MCFFTGLWTISCPYEITLDLTVSYFFPHEKNLKIIVWPQFSDMSGECLLQKFKDICFLNTLFDFILFTLCLDLHSKIYAGIQTMHEIKEVRQFLGTIWPHFKSVVDISSEI